MLHDTGAQKYVNWEVTNVIQIKNKYGFRIVLHYLDGTKKIQQKSGFLTKKVAKEERNKTIGALYSGTYIVYTDISRDGMLSGPNVKATKCLTDDTGLDIIASGGVSCMQDLKELHEAGIRGAIIGKALYENRIHLKEAVMLYEN